ncbi:MAG: DedA family protein [Deltaproteobacteria bacterium]|nr:DedA family protein [Deltaproteobacteria bacterium]
MEEFLAQYGYVAIVIGTVLEGGTVLTLAGFAAHRGLMELFPWVVAAGAVGSFVDCLVWYAFGRYGVGFAAGRVERVRGKIERIEALLFRWKALFVMGARFIPGFRTAGALGVGLWKYPWPRFLIFNAVGSWVWSVVLASVGYGFGQGLTALIGEFKVWGWAILTMLVLAAGVSWAAWHHIWRKGKDSAGKRFPGRP